MKIAIQHEYSISMLQKNNSGTIGWCFGFEWKGFFSIFFFWFASHAFRCATISVRAQIIRNTMTSMKVQQQTRLANIQPCYWQQTAEFRYSVHLYIFSKWIGCHLSVYFACMLVCNHQLSTTALAHYVLFILIVLVVVVVVAVAAVAAVC